VANGADGTRHGDRRPRDSVNVLTQAERVANVLVAELRRELREVYGEVAVGLVVLAQHDAGDDALGVNTHEDGNRSAIPAFERYNFCGPDGVSDNGVVFRTGKRLHVGRISALWRERRGVRK